MQYQQECETNVPNAWASVPCPCGEGGADRNTKSRRDVLFGEYVFTLLSLGWFAVELAIAMGVGACACNSKGVLLEFSDSLT